MLTIKWRKWKTLCRSFLWWQINLYTAELVLKNRIFLFGLPRLVRYKLKNMLLLFLQVFRPYSRCLIRLRKITGWQVDWCKPRRLSGLFPSVRMSWENFCSSPSELFHQGFTCSPLATFSLKGSGKFWKCIKVMKTISTISKVFCLISVWLTITHFFHFLEKVLKDRYFLQGSIREMVLGSTFKRSKAVFFSHLFM